jgi:hypothetical protein
MHRNLFKDQLAVGIFVFNRIASLYLSKKSKRETREYKILLVTHLCFGHSFHLRYNWFAKI